MLIATLKLISLVVGGILFYISIFLYEDEEKKVQNSLEELWIKLSDSSISQTSKLARVINTSLFQLEDGIKRIIGDQFLTFRFFKISILLSFASMLLFSVYYVETTKFIDWVSSKLNYHWGTIVFCYLLYAFSTLTLLNYSNDQSLSDSKRKIMNLFGNYLFWLFFGSILLGIFLPLFKKEIIYEEFLITAIPTSIFLLALLYDFIAIAFLRWSITKVKNSTNLFFSFILFVLGLAIYFLAILPILFVPSIESIVMSDSSKDFYKGLLQFIYLSNIPAKYVSFLIVAFIFLSLSHKLVWNTLNRFVYSIQRYKLIENKRHLIILALILISWSLNLFEDLLKMLKIGLF